MSPSKIPFDLDLTPEGRIRARSRDGLIVTEAESVTALVQRIDRAVRHMHGEGRQAALLIGRQY